MKPESKKIKSPRKKRDKADPLLVYARKLRSNLRARAKKAGLDPDEVPSASEIFQWLKSEEPLSCYYTSCSVNIKDLNIDHKEPLTLGGTNNLSNLCVTSSRMNKAKGSFTEQEFRCLLSFCNKYPSAGSYLISRLIRGFMVGRKQHDQR